MLIPSYVDSFDDFLHMHLEGVHVDTFHMLLDNVSEIDTITWNYFTNLSSLTFSGP